MKENGKIAWTSLEEIVKSFGCTIVDAMNNSASVNKALEGQKVARTYLH